MGKLLGKHPYLMTTLVILTLLVLGTGGYMVIEGWSLIVSLFMTVITVTTIGYGEVSPLTFKGRIFTIILIVLGVVAATYAVGQTIELLTSQEFLAQLRRRRRRQMLEQLNQHAIICGFGRLGSSLAKELRARGAALVVVDLSEEAIEVCKQMGIPTVLGNASDEHILREAGIQRAKSLVAATPSDAENVFIVLTSKSISPNLHIIARSNADTSVPKLEKAGANIVISPYAIVGKRIAHMITRPSVTQFLDGVLEFGDHKMRIEEFIIGQKSRLAGLTLKEARLKVVVLAVDHPGQMVFTHPNTETELLPGTAIIVMGLDQELRKLEEMVKG